jgi:hypothetical protein
MTPLVQKGLWLAALHVALVASLGAKLLIDRAMCPRVWLRAAPLDPSLPIRGRYVQLRVEVAIGPGLEFAAPPQPINMGGGQVWTPPPNPRAVVLSVQNRTVVALPSAEPEALLARERIRDGERVAVLDEPLAYFIPDTATDPSRRPAGEELWVEVTIPRHGPPRPIQLGVKKGGPITPLEIR